MAKTFDYETAWLEVALPAFKRLSGAVHLALAETVSAAGELGQLADCSMPWPEDGGKLRELFDRIDSAELAIASQTIHNYGHWWPGAPLTNGAPDLLGREIGGHWKFSHYADQVLRERAALPARGASGRGWGLAVHEGMIRLTWNDARSWNWREVAPATPEGLERAQTIRARIQSVIDTEQPDRRCTNDRGNIRYREMEKIERPDKGTDLYMIDEAELSARKAARMPEPDRERLKREKIADRDKTIRIAEVECAGYLWLIDHKFPGPGFALLLPARKFQKAVRVWLSDRHFATATIRIPYRCQQSGVEGRGWEFPEGSTGYAGKRYQYSTTEIYQAARTAAHIARQWRLVERTPEEEG